jgi:hypothetical protein
MTSCASIFCVDDLMCIDFFEVDGLKKSCASILLLDFDFLVRRLKLLSLGFRVEGFGFRVLDVPYISNKSIYYILYIQIYM